MKTLKQHLQERKYISVIYDAESQRKLRLWAIENGFDLRMRFDGSQQKEEDFKFHTTIFYSINEVNLRNQKVKHPLSSVSIAGFDMLGKENDIPVLKLKLVGDLLDLRDYYGHLGLKDEWPSFKPHITLSYAKQNIDIKKLNLPTFNPKYNMIEIEPIKD